MLLRRGEVYRKVGPGAEDEAAKLLWLHEQGVRVPEVLLVAPGSFEMRAAPGLPADRSWSEREASWVIDAVADTVRALHALDPAACPFDRSLETVVPEAHRAVATGTVDLDHLDASHSGWSGADLLAELDRSLPSPEDLCVTHGDLSLDNLIVDPVGGTVTLIDAGRAGVADRHVDLAIFTRGLRDHWVAGDTDTAEERFYRGYGFPPDRTRIELYRLIDEFF